MTIFCHGSLSVCENNVLGQASAMFNCAFTGLSGVWGPSGQQARHTDWLSGIISNPHVFLCIWGWNKQKKFLIHTKCLFCMQYLNTKPKNKTLNYSMGLFFNKLVFDLSHVRQEAIPFDLQLIKSQITKQKLTNKGMNSTWYISLTSEVLVGLDVSTLHLSLTKLET